MTADQIIAVSASVGACMSALATFLTVLQIARQRESSYRPELAISRTFFSSTTDPLAEGLIPGVWTEHEVQQAEEASTVRRTQFAVPLRNIGLGTAKTVDVSWAFDIGELTKRVNDLAQLSSTPAQLSYESGTLHLKSENVGTFTSMWCNQKHSSMDYVMSAAVDNKPGRLVLPHAYIQLVSALVFFTATEKNHGTFPEIPRLTLQLDYRDIGDQKHRATFAVQCELEAVSSNGQIIRGVVEFTKIAGDLAALDEAVP